MDSRSANFRRRCPVFRQRAERRPLLAGVPGRGRTRIRASHDPLTQGALAVLDQFARRGRCGFDAAALGLREMIGAFRRCHDTPDLADYRLLLAESAEAAWIATEGCAFNHARTGLPTSMPPPASSGRWDGHQGRDRGIHRRIGPPDGIQGRSRGTDVPHRRRRHHDVDRSGSFYEFISRDAIVGPDGSRQLICASTA